jgi:putative membrane protein
MGWHWGDGGAWWAMGFGMLFWLLLLALTVALIVWLVNRSTARGPEQRGDSAEEVLRRRFASGEIDAEEYGRRLAVLRR